MSVRSRVALGCLLLIGVSPPATAGARVPAEAAAKRPAKFTLQSLGKTPASVRAGTAFVVRGRVLNPPRRESATARITFTLRTSKRARRGIELQARGTKADRNPGQNVRLTKGGVSRRFAVRITVGENVAPRRYWFRACVRRGSGAHKASCKWRRMRIAPRPGAGGGGAGPGGGGAGPGGGGTPAPAELPVIRSLRGALTDQSFYFVMADRFENGTTANDLGGYPNDRLQSGYDPTHKGFYHGGDLKGMLDRIDYIKGLGTTAIWLTPSFKNKPVQGPPGQETAGYHGYWITDFTQIDPHLGTNQDLANLVDAAHDRGMKVFFDIITNHTADVITYSAKQGGPAPYGYVPKDTVPYRSASGTPFDDRDYAGTAGFPALSADDSFPFVPHNPAGAENPGNVNHKVPEWLNDVTAYHNRGDTTFTGENSQYGDFFGLDDLFTEQPRVLRGMTDIYKTWIREMGIDGFRIDTMKHVEDEFWQAFAPEILDYAHQQGKKDFMLFGEVFDTTKTYTSHFTTRDKVQAILDFPFQAAAQRFAASSGPTEALRDFFVGDDWYTDADSNVYQLPTFLGNHDMGRIGWFLKQANPGASDQELFTRDRLAHELMYLSRGNPVVYYGDEQGFVGDGGDQDARQDMFPSRVGTYNDDDNIATDATTADSNFDPSHPLYLAIAQLSALTKAHPALRNGPQQVRHWTSGAGIFAFSRLDRGTQREYVVALNNSEAAQTAFVPTSTARGTAFTKVYGDGPAKITSDPGRRLPVVVGPLSTVVYESDAPIPASAAAPDVAVAPLPEGGVARDRAQVGAFVDGDSFYDVTLQARVGDGDWTTIGTDDNSPYRVFHDVSGLSPGTTVTYRALVADNAGHVRASEPASVTVAEPSVTLTSPPDDGRVRNDAPLAAEVVPDHNDYAVTFQRRVSGGEWTTVATDDSQPVYTATDDVSALAAGTTIRYRAVLTYAPGRTVTSAERTATVSAPVTEAVIHYWRPAGDYANWGLHLWGDGLAAGQATSSWTDPTEFEGSDAYGALHRIQIADDTKQIGFIIHGQPPNQDTKDTPNDRFFTPVDRPEIWLKQGDPTIYDSPPPTP